MTDQQHVEFDLPKPVWFELAGIAEKHDTTVAALIADAIKNTVTAEQARLARYRARRKQIVELVHEGHTDAVICERLGETRAYVGDVRRAARLKANRPGMANHQKETA